MSPSSQTILIHAEAPAKPVPGAPCNGCGVCCLAEPCPLGVVLSGRRQGACKALRWNEASALYRCGAISAPAEVLQQAFHQSLRGLVPFLAPLLGRLARRWIAAGVGCDSTLEPPERADTT